MKKNGRFLMKMILLSFCACCLSFLTMAQTKSVTGQVYDTKGKPLSGATIAAKGKSQKTVTDADGKFLLNIAGDVTALEVSHVGMKPQEIKLGLKSSFDIVLEATVTGMDEVVVVGYGTQRKPTVVGAISTVKGTDLVKSGVPSVANSLTGLVPGLVTVQASGMPGADDSKIYIRGLSSFAGNNQPLVLVDGIERGLNDIDPNDVESINVLKDASATAVFGVKGGNGVILITTKRGQQGRMEISASYDQTFKKAVNSSIQENSYKTLAARDNLYRNRNAYGNVLGATTLNHYRTQDMPYIYPDVSLWNLMIKPVAYDSRASVSARGGTQNAKYFISLGYLHQGDLTKNYQTAYDPSFKYDRLNFRMNFDFDFSKTTKVSISSGGFVGVQSLGGYDGNGDQASIMNNMYTTPSYASPYIYPASIFQQYPDPNFPMTGDRVGINLVTLAALPGFMRKNFKGTTRTVTDRLGSDLSLTQKLDVILKGLTFKTLLSYNNDASYVGGGYTYQGDSYALKLVGNSYVWERYVGTALTSTYTPVTPPYQSGLTSTGTPAYNYVYSGQLDYRNSFQKHNVSALALAQRRVSQTAAGFKHFEENWVARATYDYDGKYLFEANMAISGSEQFAPENRFGYFPAFAGGWNIAREDFMKRLLPQVNNLKVRYSYGETGNDNTGSSYLYISDYSNYSNATLGAPGITTTVPTVREGSVPNIKAQWERNRKQDLGLEVGAFNNRLTVNVDWYDENRTGILMARRSLADWFGQSLLALNIGSVKRHGYELEVGYNGKINKMNYFVKGNFNFNENRVTNQDDPGQTPDYLKMAGKPINYNSAPLNIGYYQDADAIANYSLKQTTLMTPGADMLLDFSGDATTSNDAVPVGHSNRPDQTFSLSAGLSNRSFDFSFMVQGATSVTRNNGAYTNPLWTNDPGEMYVMLKNSDNVWTPSNRNATYGAWGAWSPGSKALQNAKYARLKTVELGYNFSGHLVKKMGLSSARLALQGANLITWAPGYILGDPENESTVSNVNFSFYPIPKRLTIALKANF